MVFQFTPSDDTLADLRGIRAALESRKSLLLNTRDPHTRALVEQEIDGLRELVLTIAHSLWDETSVERRAASGRAAHEGDSCPN